MRLKEIKPGMVIYCKDNEEKKALLEEAERLGYLWYESKQKPTEKPILSIGNAIHFYDAGKSYFSADYKHITHSGRVGRGITEFSDLILPELTAEEVVPILTEICNRYNGNEDCEGCPLNGLEHICNGNECPFTFKDYKQVIEICAQWKSDHEKKEPEIETVDICRIIEIQPDGRKRCVHEEDIVSELPFGGDERQIVQNILKRYLAEHDGEFIAVHEVVSRVKAVE